MKKLVVVMYKDKPYLNIKHEHNIKILYLQKRFEIILIMSENVFKMHVKCIQD